MQSDVIVIGGGPAGALAAAKAVQAGLSVTLLEKTTFPRFVIGESLLPKCNELLDRNNLLAKVKEHGFIVKPAAAFISQTGEYERFDFSDNLGQPYPDTFQVKREEFDTLLLEQAEAMQTRWRPPTQSRR